MKKRLIFMLLTALLAAPAFAVTDQQQKMKDCSAQATQKDLNGDARKSFMSDCLSAKPASGNSQQQKMKSCNQQAAQKHLAGDDRKQFMSTCLSAN